MPAHAGLKITLVMWNNIGNNISSISERSHVIFVKIDTHFDKCVAGDISSFIFIQDDDFLCIEFVKY